MEKHLIATYSVSLSFCRLRCLKGCEKLTECVALPQFPRVKVFLDKTTLELTEGCKKRLEEIKKARSAEKLREFYADYGENSTLSKCRACKLIQ